MISKIRITRQFNLTFHNGKAFFTIACVFGTFMKYFVFTITQLTDEMSTRNLV